MFVRVYVSECGWVSFGPDVPFPKSLMGEGECVVIVDDH